MIRAKVSMAAAASAIVVLGAGIPAFAQDKAPAAPPATTLTADQYADRAYDEYGKEKYPEAVADYLNAFQLSADPRLLFNIANIYDWKLHERELAADYYRRYLKSPTPEPQLAKRASERLAALRQEQETLAANRDAATPPADSRPPPAARPPAPEAPPPPPASSSSGLKTAGIVSLVLGGAGVVVGGVFGLLASSENDDAAKLCDANDRCTQAGLDKTTAAQNNATISTVGFVVGGVALAAGLALVIAAPSGRSSAASAAIAPTVGPGSGGVAVAGRF